MPRQMIFQKPDEYVSSDGWTLKREYGKTPNGNSINGRWVLRDETDAFIDFDKYRNDIEPRNDLVLIESFFGASR